MDWNLKELFDGENVGKLLIDEPMKNHTSFKIGGPVDALIIPNEEGQIINIIKICKRENIPYFIMGNGSNLLVKDGGIRGIVIKIQEGFNKIEIKGSRIYAQAGALVTAVSKRAMSHSLTGMEFANGIPGTVGGALTMNAGAYGGEMKDVVFSVRAIDRDLNIIDISNEEMEFGYRKSRVVRDGLILLSTVIDLKAGSYEQIEETMRDLTHRRTSKQPLELPSGGSTFKRPEGHFAGKLIQDSGLQGHQCGGAQISKKHSGFIVNVDNATCKDVLDLVKIVQDTVMDKYGIQLEREIKLIGED